MNNVYHQNPYQQNPPPLNNNQYPAQGNVPFVNNIYINGSQGSSSTNNALDDKILKKIQSM